MKKLIAGLLFVAALVIVPWLLSAAYMRTAGIVVSGKVLAKREAFLMPGGDTWVHIFEVTYEYRPLDRPYRQTVIQRVDAKFFRTLQVGSPVQVRYSPSPLLRIFAGMGLYLEGAAPLSRLKFGPPDSRDVVRAGALAVAALLGLVAYRRKSKALGLISATIAASCFPAVLLGACALCLFPALFWASRRSPDKGWGVALMLAIAMSVAVVYWSVPRSSVFPPGPVRAGTAVVRQVRVVDELWSDTWETSSERRNGVKIRQLFEMVDLEFTPEGAPEAIHVLDRVDRHSVPELREGAVVPIEYAPSNPDSARIAGATREYSRQIFTYLLSLSYGIGAIVTFILVPLAQAFRKLLFSSKAARALTDPTFAMTQINQMSQRLQLPKDDPRRKALEDAVAKYRSRRGAGEGGE